MKKWFTMLLVAAVLFSVALAEMPQAVGNLIPATAQLVDMEMDDGLRVYEYRDGNTRYDVSMRGETLLMLETTNPAGDAVSAQTDEALVAELLKLLPDAAVDGVYHVKDDGRQRRVAFLRKGGDVYEVVTEADSAKVVRMTQIFGAGEIASLPDAWRSVQDAKGAAAVTDVELEFDDGRLVYQGDASLNGRKFEFEILAENGKLLQWEND